MAGNDTAYDPTSTGSTGIDWLGSLGQIAALGAGIYSTVKGTDAAARQQQTAADLARLQATTQAQTSQSLAKWLPLLLLGGAVVIGAFFFFRKD